MTDTNDEITLDQARVIRLTTMVGDRAREGATREVELEVRILQLEGQAQQADEEIRDLRRQLRDASTNPADVVVPGDVVGESDDR